MSETNQEDISPENIDRLDEAANKAASTNVGMPTLEIGPPDTVVGMQQINIMPPPARVKIPGVKLEFPKHAGIRKGVKRSARPAAQPKSYTQNPHSRPPQLPKSKVPSLEAIQKIIRKEWKKIEENWIEMNDGEDGTVLVEEINAWKERRKSASDSGENDILPEAEIEAEWGAIGDSIDDVWGDMLVDD